ncbi:MAG: hypothetical protein HFJ06_03180 [Lachnospiraceae bacterium]|nr:hypothetical protein [Lachnospiraceae bacterium]
MLSKIRDALESLDIGPVQYGRLKNTPDLWNYIVFARDRMQKSGTSRNDYNRYYTIVIVQEDYMPEGLEIRVIKKLEEIPGLKLANDNIQYDYTVKKNSGTVVEMAVISFTEIIKGYKL